MSKPLRITIMIIIGLGILGLLAYGYFSTRQLDDVKEEKVSSNIGQHLNLRETDEKALEEEPEEEDLDGDEAEVEDTDFETLEEEAPPWEDTPTISSETESPSSPPPSTTTKSDTTYWVITGSFRSGSNARKNVRRLKKLGYDASIIRFPGNNLNSVSVGEFGEAQAAEELVSELQEEHELKAFVRKKPAEQ